MREAQFNEIFEETKLKPEFQESIAKAYSETKAALRGIIEDTEESHEIHYKDLHWRLDMEIFGKSRGSALAPKFLLNLVLDDGGKEKAMVLESNYANLKKLKEELQSAASAINLSYGRKVLKYAK